jgi:hypothetical protein
MEFVGFIGFREACGVRCPWSAERRFVGFMEFVGFIGFVGFREASEIRGSRFIETPSSRRVPPRSALG